MSGFSWISTFFAVTENEIDMQTFMRVFIAEVKQTIGCVVVRRRRRERAERRANRRAARRAERERAERAERARRAASAERAERDAAFYSTQSVHRLGESVPHHTSSSSDMW